MIIDDSSIDRRVIGKILKKRLDGINIIEEDNGLRINEKLISNNIHVCILDIMMPVKSGFQVLKEIKEDENTKDIPVIICTGIDNKDGIEKALTLGAYDYFSKPLSQEAMTISLPLKVKNAIALTKRNEEIKYLSYHDQLTGLYNRRFFEEELKRLDTSRNLPLTLIMADINGLKLVNDAFGHTMGDQLLKKTGEIFKSACRRDEIIARLGGDEFIILLPNTSLIEAEEISKRIVKKSKEIKLGPVFFSISLGYDSKTKENQSIEEIFKTAEDHMYRRKLFESPSMRGKMIKVILNSLHEKNKREEEHSIRVSYLCKLLGNEMNLSPRERDELEIVGMFHDIGKIAIDEGILNKPGSLSQLEWEEIKRHPEIGYRILSASNDMADIANYVLLHHERWDGSGYPKGIKGEKIPLQSRIVALADAYDAMISKRPYREPYTTDYAIEEIRKNSGKQFDPKLVSIFIEKILPKLVKE